MAKETKAQRQAREQAEIDALYEVVVQTYQDRLMHTMQRACEVNFELTVKDGQFLLFDRDEAHRKYWLAVKHSDDNECVLQNLSFEVNYKIAEQEQAKRKLELKRSALAKLSEEERRVLGLLTY